MEITEQVMFRCYFSRKLCVKSVATNNFEVEMCTYLIPKVTAISAKRRISEGGNGNFIDENK